MKSGKRPARVRLFGVIHYDSREKVCNELADHSRGADAVFHEHPPKFTANVLLSCFLRSPLDFLGSAFALLIAAPIWLFFTRSLRGVDYHAIRSISAEHDIPRHEVDRHPLDVQRSIGVHWSALSWLFLLAVTWIRPVPVVTTVTGVIAAGGALMILQHRRERYLPYLGIFPSWGVLWALFSTETLSFILLFGATSLYLFSVHRTLEARNEILVERLLETAAANEYENVCLVVGKAHLDGLVDLFGQTDVSIDHVHRSSWHTYTLDPDLKTDEPVRDGD